MCVYLYIKVIHYEFYLTYKQLKKKAKIISYTKRIIYLKNNRILRYLNEKLIKI